MFYASLTLRFAAPLFRCHYEMFIYATLHAFIDAALLPVDKAAASPLRFAACCRHAIAIFLFITLMLIIFITIITEPPCAIIPMPLSLLFHAARC